MADEGVFATTAEVQRKVGANASSTANVEAYINQFMAEAESLINATVRYNFSDNYSTLNGDTKEILKMAASAKAAAMVIQYDMSGYSTISEAVSMINVLLDEYDRCIKELKDKKVQQFINAS